MALAVAPPHPLVTHTHTCGGRNLCYNELSGSIPEEFTHLPSLMQLWLCNNKLTGTLPNFWSDSYIHMTNLMLSGNALSGTLPALSGMNNAMRYLSLNNNRFSGTIPPSYGNFVHLESLYVVCPSPHALICCHLLTLR